MTRGTGTLLLPSLLGTQILGESRGYGCVLYDIFTRPLSHSEDD